MKDKITSLKNPKIKETIKLFERKERDEKNRFLVEGYRELVRAVKGKEKIVTLFYAPEFFLGSNEESLINEIEKSGAEIILTAPYVFEKLSYRDRPDGLLGVAIQKHLKLDALRNIIDSTKDPLLLIAEGIEKPGNLGSILRSADGVGVDAFLGCDLKCDVYNPNAVRSSVGTLFTVPHIEAESSNTISLLQEKSIKIIASTPNCDTLFTKCDMTGGIALVVGSEQYGLTDQWLNNATFRVRIPMRGVADSLNVATATTLLLYESLRQREHLLR